LCGEVHAPFWEVRRGPRALRTEARGCAPRAGCPKTCPGAAWGTLGGWTRPRTSAIVKQRTHLTTPTSHRRRQVASRSRGQCVFQGTVHPRFEQFNVMWGAPRCLDLTSDLRDLSVARLFFESARASTYAWQRVCVRTCAASVCFLEWRTIAHSRRGRGTTSPGGAGRTRVLRRTVGGLLALERLFRPANPLLWISFTPRRCARA